MQANTNLVAKPQGIGMIFQLADGKIQSCNQNAEKIFGCSVEEISQAFSLQPPGQIIHEDGSPVAADECSAIASLKTGQPVEMVIGFYRPNGDLVWLLLNSEPLFQSSNREPNGVVTTIKDITAEKSQDSAEERSWQPSREFVELADAVPGVLYVFDAIARRNLFVNSQADNLLGYTSEQILAMGTNFTNQVMHPEDLNCLPPHIEQLNQSRSPEVFKLEYRMRHRNGEWRWFCTHDRVYRRNADGSVRLILGIARDITHRKRVEEALRESEERLNRATIASGFGMWFRDFTTGNIEWTDQCKKLFGLTPDIEVSYELFSHTLHPDDRDRVEETINQALKTKTEYVNEYRVILPDGAIRWLRAKGKGFYNQAGEAVSLMGTVEDISDRKQAEAELAETNNILQSIINDATDAIFVKDLQGRYVIANQTAAEWLDITVAEMLGQNDTALMDLKLAQSMMAIDRRVIAEGKHYSYEEEMPDGAARRSLLTNKYPWRDHAGNILGVIGIARDITQFKESKRKLQENERLLRLALANAKAGSWNWEFDTGKVIWSPENYELYGLDPQQGLIEYQDWENLVHPEDRDRANQEVQRVLSGESDEFRTEFRIVHPQQGIRWLLGIGNVSLDENGKLIRLSGINLDISDRKQTEAALRDREQHLRKLIDSLPIYSGIITTDGVVMEVNQTALKSASLQPENVLHQHFCDTYWWSYSTETKAVVENAIKRAATGERVRYDVVAQIAQEQFIVVDLNIVPVFNQDGSVEYLVASGIDISDREASKQALQRSEYELRLITEVIPQQVWTASPDGKIDYINQRWQDYIGYTLEQIQRRGWSSIIHPEDLQHLRDTWAESIRTGKKYDMEARLRRADGRYCWFLGRGRPLRNQEGEIIKWYGTNTNITRIKELEDKLRQQADDLIKANRIKDEFLAIVSHELRTPLNPILGWSQLLTGGMLDAEQTTKGLETIQRNAKLQAQLIEDLLDVSRILRGKLNLNLVPLNLASVITAALATVQLTAEAKSIQIETAFEPNIGQVSGDTGRLQQIVWNLVSNSIKFTPEGGQIIVKLERVEQFAQIIVQDTGKGIEPGFLPYVFDRFRQAESSSTRKFGGLGLGLSIVRHLTELHGGTVDAESPGGGRGATFRVKLPLIDLPTAAPTSNELGDWSLEPIFCEGIRVLIVDDELDSRDILAFALEREGAEVTSVASAAEALKALENKSYDLLLSDLEMPEVDGCTLISRVRTLPHGKNLPAIALTAYAAESDRQRSIDAGFNRHLSKPIDIPQLITVIMQLIG
ncbi:PAS domain S-box protein [Pleurocapsales cyanobacterium LEGE 10410]|nr:PAS domain S-box protein [Pleurocapsales cyanobacterium LEGE 10410]